MKQQLRCITCNGQSILESETDSARKMRTQVDELIKNGKSEAEILNIMREKYGDFVVFAPKMDINNLFVWLVPFILLLLGTIYFWKLSKQSLDKNV
ncbi:MAG: hypothetical protein BGO27_08025 [Alphaproteobacteria bacterium 33-17]|nr:MAG: hypothetical protein BGO27_08025 [Alphaproteobacteria bacterium 33-17]